MTEAQTLKTLQLFYAGLLVDTVRQYHKLSILEKATESKRIEQELAAAAQLARLEITNTQELFDTFQSIFGCASWTVTADSAGYQATSRSCLACAIAKKLGAPSPCAIACINPFKAMAKSLPVPQKLEVRQTLWDSDSCVFTLTA